MKKNIEKQHYFSLPLLILGSIWLILCFFGVGKIDEAEMKINCCTDQLKEISVDTAKTSDSLFSIQKTEDMNKLFPD